MSEEKQLIDAAREGSVSAFTRLVQAYREKLLRFLVTRSASYADAEDALQDTFVNAFRYLDSYDPRWRFSTWLYRIAIRNLARVQGRESAELPEIPDESADPLLHCIEASEAENLWVTARRLLTGEVYSALWLRYVEDMSIRDVAAVLDRSESWTKVNLLRARQVLGSELAAPGNQGSKAYG